MVTEQPVRRRRRRGRKGGPAGGKAPPAGTAERESREARASRPGRSLSEWQWFTFPVFFAFVAGGLLMLLILPEPNTLLYSVLFFAFLGAGAYGVSHMLVRWYVTRQRR